MNEPKLDLQAAVPEPGGYARIGSRPAPAADLPDRARLARELDYYLGRVAELDKLDPHDFTGLKRVYGEHVQRTRALLARIDA